MLHEEDEMHEQVYPDPDLRDNYTCINKCYDKNQAKLLKCKCPPPLLAEVMTHPGSAQLGWWLGEMYKHHDGSVLVHEKRCVIYHGCHFTQSAPVPCWRTM